jgi:predicted HNH restriction endonuclease
MIITKHGEKHAKESKKVYFKCDFCKCEFTAEEDEYYRDYGGAESLASALSGSITISYKTKDYLVCSCPECHKIVKFLDERETSSENVIPVGLSGT